MNKIFFSFLIAIFIFFGFSALALANTYGVGTYGSGVYSTASAGGSTTGGGTAFGCKDPKALNYNSFLVHNQTLCKYSTEIAPSTAYVFTKTLKLKSKNSEVKQLQIFLNSHNYVLAKTGAGSLGHETTYFGKITLKAVKAFQKANKLVPDGIVGKLTRAKLNQ